MLYDIHIIPVIVSALLAAAIAYVWFSPLVFGIPWMRACGLSVENQRHNNTAFTMVATLVIFHTMFFFVIAQLLMQTTMNMQALALSGIGYTVCVVTQQGVLAILERKPLTYMLITAGYTAIVVCGGIGVIAYWPW